MSGDYDGARTKLKKVCKIRKKDDLHDLLLIAECSTLLSDPEGDGVKELQGKIRDTHMRNDRIKHWASLFFPRPEQHVDSLRSVGGIILMGALMKKYEHEGVSREDYVKELRDFTVGMDGVGYHVIKHNFHMQAPLINFFSSVRADLRDKLEEYNGFDNPVDRACLNHGMITNYCVDGEYERALREAKRIIFEIESALARPSQYKIYARLLMWLGILRVKRGEVEGGIVDMVKAKAAMDDATDYLDNTDRAYLMHTVELNMKYALVGKANLESVQGDMYNAAYSPAASAPARPQAASGDVKHQAGAAVAKSTGVKHKATAKGKSPKSKSRWRKSK